MSEAFVYQSRDCFVCVYATIWFLQVNWLNKLGINVLTIKLNPPLLFSLFLAHGEQSWSKCAEFFSARFPSRSACYMFVYIKFVSGMVLIGQIDSLASRKPQGVLGVAFKFMRHRCKLSLFAPKCLINLNLNQATKYKHGHLWGMVPYKSLKTVFD